MALSPWGTPFFTLANDHAHVFAQLPAAVHRGVLDAYVRSASHRGLRDDDLAMLTAPWKTPEGQEAFSFYRQIAQADEKYTREVENDYGTITEPVRIIWDTRDPWLPVDTAPRLHASIPHSTLSLIENAGHLIQLDTPAELTAELTPVGGAAPGNGIGAAAEAPAPGPRYRLGVPRATVRSSAA